MGALNSSFYPQSGTLRKIRVFMYFLVEILSSSMTKTICFHAIGASDQDNDKGTKLLSCLIHCTTRKSGLNDKGTLSSSDNFVELKTKEIQLAALIVTILPV